MPHTTTNQKKLLTRIRRIRGQAEALERLLEGEHECIKVLQQVAAMRGATNGLMQELMEGHIREHLVNEDIPIAERKQELEGVISALKSYLK